MWLMSACLPHRQNRMNKQFDSHVNQSNYQVKHRQINSWKLFIISIVSLLIISKHLFLSLLELCLCYLNQPSSITRNSLLYQRQLPQYHIALYNITHISFWLGYNPHNQLSVTSNMVLFFCIIFVFIKKNFIV